MSSDFAQLLLTSFKIPTHLSVCPSPVLSSPSSSLFSHPSHLHSGTPTRPRGSIPPRKVCPEAGRGKVQGRCAEVVDCFPETLISGPGMFTELLII